MKGCLKRKNAQQQNKQPTTVLEVLARYYADLSESKRMICQCDICRPPVTQARLFWNNLMENPFKIPGSAPGVVPLDQAPGNRFVYMERKSPPEKIEARDCVEVLQICQKRTFEKRTEGLSGTDLLWLDLEETALKRLMMIFNLVQA